MRLIEEQYWTKLAPGTVIRHVFEPDQRECSFNANIKQKLVFNRNLVHPTVKWRNG